ncbi:MAG: hypothetical protein M3R15_22285 [Acidobacteriota bacterium]|nr:hypothetical protein [Acidobacteriota bacterium]
MDASGKACERRAVEEAFGKPNGAIRHQGRNCYHVEEKIQNTFARRVIDETL